MAMCVATVQTWRSEEDSAVGAVLVFTVGFRDSEPPGWTWIANPSLNSVAILGARRAVYPADDLPGIVEDHPPASVQRNNRNPILPWETEAQEPDLGQDHRQGNKGGSTLKLRVFGLKLCSCSMKLSWLVF